MKVIKKLFVTLLLLCLLLPIFAAEEEWYLDRPITEINFEGLTNVKSKTASSVLSAYIGSTLTNESYEEIENKLYAQNWVDYVIPYVEVAEDGWGVSLTFEVSENPKISSINVYGNDRLRKATILEAQNFTIGDYFSSDTSKANAQLVKDLYLQKGYVDVEVTADVDYTNDSKVSITYQINEGLQYKIRNIRFEGNENFSSQELIKVLSSKQKSFFNSGNFQQSLVDPDKMAVLNYYANKGYPDCEIISVDIETIEEELTEKTNYINLTFRLKEGELWTLGKVTFDGNEAFDDETINNLITIQEGDLFNLEKIQNIYGKIAALYYDNGYVYSQVTPEIQRNNGNLAVISFSITEGPQAVVEEIRINGLTKTKPHVLEREIAIKVGQIFSRADFIQSQQNMYNTSLLKNISAKLYPGVTENGVICEFDVEEGDQMELQFGATFGATEVDGFPVSGFLSWTNNNLMGTGRTMSVSTNLSPSTQNISFGLSDKWVGNKRWSNGFSFSAERDVRSNSLQQGIGSQPYSGRDKNHETYPLGYSNPMDWFYTAGQVYPEECYLMDYVYGKLNLGYTTGYSFVFQPGTLSVSAGASIGLNKSFYDESKYTPYEKLIQKYHEKWQLSNKLIFSVSWDGRNLVSANPHGYVLSSSYTYAGGILQGLSNYNKLSLSASAYTGIWSFKQEDAKDKHLILGFSTELEFMFDQYWNNEGSVGWHNPKEGATKYEMLYIDGMNIGRGFNVVYDQAFLWHNQIDLTYPLAEKIISLEGFVSATGVQEELSDVKGIGSIEWYFAAGAGIKMEIPGFPLGLYLVKNATMIEKNNKKWNWKSGSLFSNKNEGSGLSLVLAITTSIY